MSYFALTALRDEEREPGILTTPTTPGDFRGELGRRSRGQLEGLPGRLRRRVGVSQEERKEGGV